MEKLMKRTTISTKSEREINQTTKEIKDLRVSIADLEKKIEERDEVLRERVLAMQVQGRRSQLHRRPSRRE